MSNEEIKQKADELVGKTFWTVGRDVQQSVKIAILSTKNTIELLKSFELDHNILVKLDEQTEILKELESRI